jgi:hypothetical protein
MVDFKLKTQRQAAAGLQLKKSYLRPKVYIYFLIFKSRPHWRWRTLFPLSNVPKMFLKRSKIFKFEQYPRPGHVGLNISKMSKNVQKCPKVSKKCPKVSHSVQCGLYWSASIFMASIFEAWQLIIPQLIQYSLAVWSIAAFCHWCGWQ